MARSKKTILELLNSPVGSRFKNSNFNLFDQADEIISKKAKDQEKSSKPTQNTLVQKLHYSAEITPARKEGEDKDDYLAEHSEERKTLNNNTSANQAETINTQKGPIVQNTHYSAKFAPIGKDCTMVQEMHLGAENALSINLDDSELNQSVRSAFKPKEDKGAKQEEILKTGGWGALLFENCSGSWFRSIGPSEFKALLFLGFLDFRYPYFKVDPVSGNKIRTILVSASYLSEGTGLSLRTCKTLLQTFVKNDSLTILGFVPGKGNFYLLNKRIFLLQNELKQGSSKLTDDAKNIPWCKDYTLVQEIHLGAENAPKSKFCTSTGQNLHHLGAFSAPVRGKICTQELDSLKLFKTFTHTPEWYLARFEEMGESERAIEHRNLSELIRQYPGEEVWIFRSLEIVLNEQAQEGKIHSPTALLLKSYFQKYRALVLRESEAQKKSEQLKTLEEQKAILRTQESETLALREHEESEAKKKRIEAILHREQAFPRALKKLCPKKAQEESLWSDLLGKPIPKGQKIAGMFFQRIQDFLILSAERSLPPDEDEAERSWIRQQVDHPMFFVPISKNS